VGGVSHLFQKRGRYYSNMVVKRGQVNNPSWREGLIVVAEEQIQLRRDCVESYLQPTRKRK